MPSTMRCSRATRSPASSITRETRFLASLKVGERPVGGDNQSRSSFKIMMATTNSCSQRLSAQTRRPTRAPPLTSATKIVSGKRTTNLVDFACLQLNFGLEINWRLVGARLLQFSHDSRCDPIDERAPQAAALAPRRRSTRTARFCAFCSSCVRFCARQ